MDRLTIVADENIPNVETLFSTLGNVTLVNGRQLARRQLIDADILLVRSVTAVNRDLLAGTKVRFVATATIGTDHLDIPYLEANNIAWANAPGSNAHSVVDYIISCFCRLDGVLSMLLNGAVVGIVGMGNVGAALYQRLSALGVTCKAYDPLIEQDRYAVLTDLDDVLTADVICCHAPLTTEGSHPSHHLLGEQRLETLGPSAVLINAGRGGVVDNDALLALLPERHDLCVVLDVWGGEPDINIELMKRVDLATPHIAGYSADGKLAGASMVYRACCDYFSRQYDESLSGSDSLIDLSITECSDVEAAIIEAVLTCYDVAKDDQRMRGALLQANTSERATAFDTLRKQYPVRREFSRYKIKNATELKPAVMNALAALGFQV